MTVRCNNFPGTLIKERETLWVFDKSSLKSFSCGKSVLGESDLKEAETTFTVFQIHLFGIKVEQRPAESRRLGLLEGLQLRHLADNLHAGSDRHTTTVTGLSMGPVLIHLVFWGDNVTRHGHKLSWRITSLVMHRRFESKLRSRWKSHISYCVQVMDLIKMMIYISEDG